MHQSSETPVPRPPPLGGEFNIGRVFIIIIIIGRLQSRRLRASSSHNDPVPIQTAFAGQSCCLCLPKGEKRGPWGRASMKK